MFGTTPSTAYIESSAGVAAGGRTGLTTVTVAVLFALAAFFGPLVSAVSGVSAITAPSLIIVGSLMMGSVRHIDWDAFDEAFPAFFSNLKHATYIKYRNRYRTWIYFIPTYESGKR